MTQLPKDDSFTDKGRVSYMDPMKLGGIPQDIFDRYSQQVEEVAIYERILEESDKINKWDTQFLEDKQAIESSDVIQVHLAN